MNLLQKFIIIMNVFFFSFRFDFRDTFGVIGLCIMLFDIHLIDAQNIAIAKTKSENYQNKNNMSLIQVFCLNLCICHHNVHFFSSLWSLTDRLMCKSDFGVCLFIFIFCLALFIQSSISVNSHFFSCRFSFSFSFYYNNRIGFQ